MTTTKRRPYDPEGPFYAMKGFTADGVAYEELDAFPAADAVRPPAHVLERMYRARVIASGRPSPEMVSARAVAVEAERARQEAADKLRAAQEAKTLADAKAVLTKAAATEVIQGEEPKAKTPPPAARPATRQVTR